MQWRVTASALLAIALPDVVRRRGSAAEAARSAAPPRPTSSTTQADTHTRLSVRSAVAETGSVGRPWAWQTTAARSPGLLRASARVTRSRAAWLIRRPRSTTSPVSAEFPHRFRRPACARAAASASLLRRGRDGAGQRARLPGRPQGGSAVVREVPAPVGQAAEKTARPRPYRTRPVPRPVTSPNAPRRMRSTRSSRTRAAGHDKRMTSRRRLSRSRTRRPVPALHRNVRKRERSTVNDYRGVFDGYLVPEFGPCGQSGLRRLHRAPAGRLHGCLRHVHVGRGRAARHARREQTGRGALPDRRVRGSGSASCWRSSGPTSTSLTAWSTCGGTTRIAPGRCLRVRRPGACRSWPPSPRRLGA